MKVIVVSGTPGTGKTTIARRIANVHRYKYVDGNAVIRRFHLAEGFDKALRTKIVDPKRFVRSLIGYINASREKGLVIDSHLSHELPSRYVDECIITKTSILKLRDRLRKRGYPKRKIEENVDAENLDVCLNEAREQKHKIRVVRT